MIRNVAGVLQCFKSHKIVFDFLWQPELSCYLNTVGGWKRYQQKHKQTREDFIHTLLTLYYRLLSLRFIITTLLASSVFITREFPFVFSALFFPHAILCWVDI